VGAEQYVAARLGYLPAAGAERTGIQPLCQFSAGDPPYLLARPDLEHLGTVVSALCTISQST